MPAKEPRASRKPGDKERPQNGRAAPAPRAHSNENPPPPPPPPPPEGALDETVAEMVVEEDLRVLDDGAGDAGGAGEALLSLGPAAPGRGAMGGAEAGAFEPWIHQLEGGYDPEAGIMRVADKRFSLRRLAPPGSLGQVVLSLVWFLVAVNLAILAVILQDPQYVYTAPVITPLGLFMSIRMFRKWKGHRALTIRIEETLEGPVTEQRG